MKKLLKIMFAVMLVALLCSVFVACDSGTTPSGEDVNDGNNQYETAKYTVIFSTGTNFTFEGSVLKDVVAGSKISEPVDAAGNKIKPTKKGYVFDCWTYDGKNEFDFKTQTINKNTTLTAKYTPITFKHNYVLDATYTYNEDGTVTVKEGTYEADTGYKMSFGADAKLQSIYNGQSALDCPKAEKADGTTDTFYFWFFINKDGKAIQFSNVAKSDDANVEAQEAYKSYTLTYNEGSSLTLYPMFRSTLPEIKVQYLAKDGTSVWKSETLRAFDTIAEADLQTPEDASNNYKFSKWYYEVVNSDDEIEKIDMVFSKDKVVGTTMSDACELDSYFEGGTLKLYSKWIRQIVISDSASYDSIYSLLHKDSPTDAEKAEIEEILEANIEIKGNIDFNSAQYKPLFDANHVFRGTIDGGTYDTDGKVASCAVMENGVFADTTHASVFGYVNGIVKNLVLKNNRFAIEKDGEIYSDNVLLGAVASINYGKISNINVVAPTFDIDGLNNVTLGGITAISQGSASNIDKGYIDNCNVGSTTAGIDISALNCKSIIFGGIAGENKSSSVVIDCKVYITVDSITSASAKIGGLVGNNGGQTVQCDVVIEIKNADVENGFYFGGAVADNAYAVQKVRAVAKLGTETAATVGASLSQTINIGGIAGKNDGYIQNSHTDTVLNVNVAKSGTIAIGGIVGNNFTGKSQSSTSPTSAGAVYYSYSVGSIVVNVNADVQDAKLYVAGILGRNSQKCIGSCFTTVDIEVTNKTASGTNNDKNNIYLGYGFGSMENKSTVTKCWYLNANVLKLNGEDYKSTLVDEEEQENFAITKTAGLKAADIDATNPFENENWLTNTDHLELDNKDVWFIENGALPKLVIFK